MCELGMRWIGPRWPALVFCAALFGAGMLSPARAQTTPSNEESDLAAQKFEEAMAGAENATSEEADADNFSVPLGPGLRVNLLNLLLLGGWLMWPIVAVSVVVVMFTLERGLALRRGRVIPSSLVGALGGLTDGPREFDPRVAYQICQKYPSVAARVIRTMLQKVGRPHSEVELAVTQANEREAARLYANVRTLNLAAGVSPLLGLLGTVWGMIQAFFTTANLPGGESRAEFLAEGIYVALVTTFAGLCVAIPALIMSHLYEGRIQRLFRDIDELLATLLPHVEQFEGKLRGNRPLAPGERERKPRSESGPPRPPKREPGRASPAGRPARP